MIICGFAQSHQEAQNGNLQIWMRAMQSVCNEIYIFDQGSTDNSRDIYESYKNVHVIYNDKNDFVNELKCKARLLDFARENNPEISWFFQCDIDTILERQLLDRSKFEEMLMIGDAIDVDAISLSHINLWRSDVWERRDSDYDYFDHVGLVWLWKNKPGLKFDEIDGLHKPQFPSNIKTVLPMLHYKLIHRAHVTDKAAIKKYEHYKELEKLGFISPGIERLIDETNLKVVEVDKKLFPEWYEIKNDRNPIELEKLINIYERKHRI
jgi:hypothetical protein